MKKVFEGDTLGYQLRFEPIQASFGARVSGVGLASISDREFKIFYEAWLEYGLLICEGQNLNSNDQVKFAKKFGELEFELASLSNVLEDGELRPDDGTDDVMNILYGNMDWHHDSTYMPVQAKGAVFTAEIVPSEGGATGFADMRAAYDALDDRMRQKLEGLKAHHSLHYSQNKLGFSSQSLNGSGIDKKSDLDGYGFHEGPVSIRPLVKEHPETGRKNLIIGRHAYDIIGFSEKESEELLNWLRDFACQPPRIYHHQWQAGDAVVWDNRRLMHQATAWPTTQPRKMWHSRMAGDPKTEAALSD